MEARTEVTPQQVRIHEFRSNPIRQQALLTTLETDENLKTALMILEHEKKAPALPLDAPEIASVRALAMSRGAERVMDILYLLATPVPPLPPEEVKEGNYGVDLSKLPPETE